MEPVRTIFIACGTRLFRYGVERICACSPVTTATARNPGSDSPRREKQVHAFSVGDGEKGELTRGFVGGILKGGSV
jgi:hypothetical protein